MALQPGDLILNGKYRVEAFIGRGAFAEVFCATHVELNVPRAIKVLRANAAGVGSTTFNDFRERYKTEFQIAARLDHPNVIKVYDLTEERGALWAVLKYAAGGNLRDLIAKSGTLPIDQAVQIMLDCAAGLDALHEIEVVHRDVKPSNILLDKAGHAKIADLGLAQLGGGQSSMRSELGSAVGMHPGTPDYRSPEHNSWEPLTPTSDVYSLGCVAFEMLTGKAWKRAMHKAAQVRDLRPDVPEWLDSIVMRMLCETPGLRVIDADNSQKRYVTMEAIVGAARREVDAQTRRKKMQELLEDARTSAESEPKRAFQTLEQIAREDPNHLELVEIRAIAEHMLREQEEKTRKQEEERIEREREVARIAEEEASRTQREVQAREAVRLSTEEAARRAEARRIQEAASKQRARERRERLEQTVGTVIHAVGRKGANARDILGIVQIIPQTTRNTIVPRIIKIRHLSKNVLDYSLHKLRIAARWSHDAWLRVRHIDWKLMSAVVGIVVILLTLLILPFLPMSSAPLKQTDLATARSAPPSLIASSTASPSQIPVLAPIVIVTVFAPIQVPIVGFTPFARIPTMNSIYIAPTYPTLSIKPIPTTIPTLDVKPNAAMGPYPWSAIVATSSIPRIQNEAYYYASSHQGTSIETFHQSDSVLYCNVVVKTYTFSFYSQLPQYRDAPKQVYFVWKQSDSVLRKSEPKQGFAISSDFNPYGTKDGYWGVDDSYFPNEKIWKIGSYTIEIWADGQLIATVQFVVTK